MQDNTSSYTVVETLNELRDRSINTIKWPPFSPDLNPIESTQNWIKDFIEDKYSTNKKPTYLRLRRYILEIQNELLKDYLVEFLASMLERCQAIIDANRIYTKYQYLV